MLAYVLSPRNSVGKHYSLELKAKLLDICSSVWPMVQVGFSVAAFFLTEKDILMSTEDTFYSILWHSVLTFLKKKKKKRFQPNVDGFGNEDVQRKVSCCCCNSAPCCNVRTILKLLFFNHLSHFTCCFDFHCLFVFVIGFALLLSCPFLICWSFHERKNNP